MERQKMNITLTLNILGHHIGAFNIHIDTNHPTTLAQPVIDKGVKRMTRWWTNRMAS